MKTVVRKKPADPARNSRGSRANRARLERLLKEMLQSGMPLDMCTQSTAQPTYRRIIE